MFTKAINHLNFLFFVFIFSSSLYSAVSYETKSFEMEYAVHEGTAVCWQTCRYDSCEEVSYALFWDAETYAILNSLVDQGKVWRMQSGKACSNGSIAFTPEHMPLLMKSDPKKAMSILLNGTKVKIMIYDDIENQVKYFIKKTLNP